MKDSTKYWIISDTHFGHDKFYTPEEKEKFFKLLQRTIGPNDVLIHLGDVAFNDRSFWNRRVAGLSSMSWLIKGNHDRQSYKWYLERGWNFVADSFTLHRAGLEILFTHKPQRHCNECDSVNIEQINIHGHLHTKENSHRQNEYSLTTYNHLIEEHTITDLDALLNKIKLEYF